MLASVSALADPPPASPTPPATPAAVAPAPPPFALAAPPPQSDLGRPLYPSYFYLPLDSASPQMPGMPGVPSRRVWYGWQTLFVYAGATTVGLTSLFSGIASGSEALVFGGTVIGGAGLVLGGPIVHWAHGNTARGFAALGLSLGAPLVGAALGVGIGCAAGACGNGSQGFGVAFGIIFGGAAGVLTAMVVDVSALSYETKAAVGSSASTRSPGWTILPDLKISREKTTFGVAGVF